MGRKTKRPRAEGEAPKKCDFRQRAHSNPLADVGEDGHPTHPTRVDWHASFPQYVGSSQHQWRYISVSLCLCLSLFLPLSDSL
jgi:hypothetical protein